MPRPRGLRAHIQARVDELVANANEEIDVTAEAARGYMKVVVDAICDTLEEGVEFEVMWQGKPLPLGIKLTPSEDDDGD